MQLTLMSRDRGRVQVRSTIAAPPATVIAKGLLHADAEPRLTAEPIAHLDAKQVTTRVAASSCSHVTAKERSIVRADFGGVAVAAILR